MDADFGGNFIRKLKLGSIDHQEFATGPYDYYYLTTHAKDRIEIKGLQSYCIYFLPYGNCPEILVESLDQSTVKEIGQSFLPGCAVHAERMELSLKMMGGSAQLLVAGTRNSNAKLSEIQILNSNQMKRVPKPWGHELWINGEHPLYSFKQILIKAGTKTSLQYHRQKKETNVLFEGKARVHYKDNPSVQNDQVKTTDISQTEIESVASVDILPHTLHRIEAITDVMLYEVSTPHLDDVVRVSDDTGRKDGRILHEHDKLRV